MSFLTRFLPVQILYSKAVNIHPLYSATTIRLNISNIKKDAGKRDMSFGNTCTNQEPLIIN